MSQTRLKLRKIKREKIVRGGRKEWEECLSTHRTCHNRVLLNLRKGDGRGARAARRQIIAGRCVSCAVGTGRLQEGPIVLEFRHDLAAMLGALQVVIGACEDHSIGPLGIAAISKNVACA